MTTSAEIINRCFRENNLIQIGGVPSTAQSTEALNYLNRVLMSLIGTDAGQLLTDWPLPYTSTNYARYPLYPDDPAPDTSVTNAPPPNSRLLVSITAPTTIYFQYNPPDGARMGLVNISADLVSNPLTINANGRLIQGAATLVVSDPATRLWFYRADLADWRLLSFPLTLTDDIPFPEHFDDFFVSMLAVRIAPLYGKTPNEITVSIAQNGMQQFRQRYAQKVVEANFPEAATMGSYQSYGGPGWYPWY